MPSKINKSQTSSFLGIIYMIIAFYLLCKEYLVPSLFAIADKGSCSQDVTSGFVMATGISMPGLITGIIGVLFSSPPEVGIGKMVGSINFNILVLIGYAGLISNSKIGWCCIFREIGVFFASLVLVCMFFIDQDMAIYESIVLVLFYFIYFLLVKFSPKLNCCKKKVQEPIGPKDIELEPKNEVPNVQIPTVSHYTRTR